jgi:VWFA-related protein
VITMSRGITRARIRGRSLLLALLSLSTIALIAGRVFAAGPQAQQSPSTQKVQPVQQTQGQGQNQNQSQLPQPKLKVESKLVYVNAVVRDKKGKIVSTLNKEDFTLDEDGRPQTITNFIRESDLPLTLGLLVDTSMSQRTVLNSERDASYTFLDQMLRPDRDKAFVIHFDHEVELLRDLTADRAKLKSALDELQIASYEQTSDESGDDDGGGQGRGHHGGGTHLYDAVYLASNELMKKQQGRKALFILSDGVDRGSKESLEDAIEAAQRADTSVYSIYYASEKPTENQGGGHHGGWRMGGPGLGYPGGGYPGGGGGYPGGGGGQRTREARPDGKKILERISTETGGRLFQVSKKLTVSDIYAQVQEELRNQYTLGYAPDRATTGADDYHKIHLTTKQTDLVVQARDGYYSN